MKSLEPTPEHRTAFLDKLTGFATDAEHQRRLIFTKICVHLSTHLSKEEFERELLTPLLAMVADPVPNIRFSVAKTLSTLTLLGISSFTSLRWYSISQSETYEEDSRISDAMKALQQDTCEL